MQHQMSTMGMNQKYYNNLLMTPTHQLTNATAMTEQNIFHILTLPVSHYRTNKRISLPRAANNSQQTINNETLPNALSFYWHRDDYSLHIALPHTNPSRVGMHDKYQSVAYHVLV